MGLQLFLIVQSAKQLRQQGDEPDHPGHNQHAAQGQLAGAVVVVDLVAHHQLLGQVDVHVLLHELAHLRYRDHGVGFHGFLEEMCADNMLRLSSLGDPYADEVMASVRKSRSARPYSHVLEREVKKYRLL